MDIEGDKRVKRLLVCVLSDEEVRERSAKSSRLLGDLEEARTREKNAERARKRVVDNLPETAELSEIRSECESIESEARRHARVSREGKEERQVECEWQHRGEREVLVRLDTGELVDSRPLAKQPSLPGLDDHQGEGGEDSQGGGGPTPDDVN